MWRNLRDRWLVPMIVFAASVLAVPGAARSQCSVTYTMVGTLGVTYIYVSKYLAATEMCTLTMFMNVFGCDPGGQTPTGPMVGNMDTTMYLTASARTTATNPSCGWNCGCGQVVIDGTDGLPVELLDFEVVQVEASGDAPTTTSHAGPLRRSRTSGRREKR